MPSLYAWRPGPIGEEIRLNRAMMRYSDIIPWLQSGNLGEMPAEILRCCLLETLLNGGRGAAYYTHAGFDAADMRAVSQAVAMLRPYEDTIIQGQLLDGATCERESVRLSAIRSGDRALLLVGEYQTSDPIECIVTPPEGFGVAAELTSDEPVALDQRQLTVTLDDTRGRVYLLEAQ
jgi:hypothetical protein